VHFTLVAEKAAYIAKWWRVAAALRATVWSIMPIHMFPFAKGKGKQLSR
jgi:hypothetical protein